MMFNLKNSIQPRLILLFVLQIVIILTIAGVYLQWQIRNKLEDELGKNLETIAKLTSTQIDAEIIANLSPGDEETRSYRNILNTLNLINNTAAVKRIYIFDKNYNSLADTKQGVLIGWGYVNLKFDESELSSVFNGESKSSVLFEGEDGQLYKSGYAPIFQNGEVIAAVRIEGSASTLKSIKVLRKNLITLGVISVLGAIILAIIFSNRITVPLKQLQQSATEIGRGNYSTKIESKSKDEVGFLAETLEEMRQNIVHRDQQQKAMLAGVAHEIRNPLGGIELFAGIISDEIADAEVHKKALKILKEVRNLKKIINDFLDYARPPSPNKQVCSPKDIYYETLSLLSNEINQTKIKYVAQNDDLKVEIDPQHLKQIFMNLIKNALQAINKNGDIEIKVQTGSNGNIHLIFTDNGTGIPVELHHKIFHPFFTTSDTGTGLGLAIVKSLVEANGGHIELVKEYKKGTQFRIEFPNNFEGK